MSEIGPISHHQAAIRSVNGRQASSQPAKAARTPDRTDSVELSTTARLLAQLRNVPDVREDLVDRARHNIQAGVYDAQAIIDLTVDRVAEDL
jgi:anti-sigma28 factor (negative regulator of flagellin synthesis)